MAIISVIVPIYNSENYIEKCVNSIKSQTYEGWELLLIDDGSTDNTSEIIDELEKTDSRIKVIHQKNCGPGIARNIGIDNSSGDYIVFVDSDDVIKSNYFEELSKKDSDVVFIDIDQVDENGKVICKEHLSDYKKLARDDFIRCQMTGKILWGGVRKAVKTNLLKTNKIRFTEHKVGEEAIYSFLLMHYAKSFSFINGSVYEYVNHTGSQSDTKDDDPWGSVANALKKRVFQMGLYDEYANTINAFFTTAAIVSLDKMCKNYNFPVFINNSKKRIDRLNKEMDSRYPIDFKHMPQKAIILFPFIRYRLMSPVYFASHIKDVYSSIKRKV